MLPDEAAHVSAIGARLAAKARRVCGIADRQLARIENLAAMHVRQRHFCGGHHVQVPLPRYLEQVRFELRQIAGTGQGRAVRHERRLDLSVAVLPGVQIEHEIDQGASESSTRSDERCEPRARNLGPALEIDDPERRPEIPMRLRRERERAGRAMPSDLDVVGRALPNRHAGVRDVGNHEKMTLPPLLDPVELAARFLDALRPLATDFLKGADVAPLPFRTARFLASRILLALESLDLRNQATAVRIECRKGLELLAQVHTAVLDRGANSGHVVSEEYRIEHAASILYLASRSLVVGSW